MGLLISLLLLGGCAGRYFHPLEQPERPGDSISLAQWSPKEYWTGIVFNGQKIGFTHFRLEARAGQFAIHSEAVLKFHFLGIGKSLVLRATDIVGPDLQLLSFEYEYRIDESYRRILGERRADELEVTLIQQGAHEVRRLTLGEALYPSSVISLYPLLHGLQVGQHYRYPIFEGETMQIAELEQHVAAYERSELFPGPAYRLESRLLGQETQTWIDAQGLPVFEMSLNGVIISALETEQRARRYLALGALNKQESLLDYSLVRTAPIAEARRTERLELRLTGLPEGFVMATDPYRQCQRVGAALHCTLRRASLPAGSAAAGEVPSAYLQPSISAPSQHPAIELQARAIAADAVSPEVRVQRLLAWLDRHIEKRAVDAFSALEVLEQKQGECQGHSYLYTAMARALGIPTRVVNGLVYSEIGPGFLYHTWAESWLDGAWIPVDPTFGQLPADATHLKLVEGETMAALSRIIPLIGRLEARILSVNEQATDPPQP